MVALADEAAPVVALAATEAAVVLEVLSFVVVAFVALPLAVEFAALPDAVEFVVLPDEVEFELPLAKTCSTWNTRTKRIYAPSVLALAALVVAGAAVVALADDIATAERGQTGIGTKTIGKKIMQTPKRYFLISNIHDRDQSLQNIYIIGFSLKKRKN